MGSLYFSLTKNQAPLVSGLSWGIGDDQDLSVRQLWERVARSDPFATYADEMWPGPGQEGPPASAFDPGFGARLQELLAFPRAHDCRPGSGFLRPRALIQRVSLRTRFFPVPELVSVPATPRRAPHPSTGRGGKWPLRAGEAEHAESARASRAVEGVRGARPADSHALSNTWESISKTQRDNAERAQGCAPLLVNERITGQRADYWP